VKLFTKSALRGIAAAKLQHAVELINPHLYAVEERIREQARAFDPAVEGYVAYTLGSAGKRLRPTLTLLSGASTGVICSSHIDLAVIVELIHLATLVHDDIMDGAEMRREQPTANAKWGTTIAVLLGDCLFAHALKLATGFQNPEVNRRIAHAATDVCSGEIIQTQRRYDLNLSQPDYLQIIQLKTAALFAVGAELGALISEASPELIGAMKTFGLKLGTAYQIFDDCLDIAGNEDKAGKTLGSDLRKGKLTLPLIFFLESVPPGEFQRINQLLLRGDSEELADLSQEVIRSGSLRRAIHATKSLVHEAQLVLQQVPITKFSRALSEVGDFLANTVDQFEEAA
jgi:octaprenyl-diphosphate synthase